MLRSAKAWLLGGGRPIDGHVLAGIGAEENDRTAECGRRGVVAVVGSDLVVTPSEREVRGVILHLDPWVELGAARAIGADFFRTQMPLLGASLPEAEFRLFGLLFVELQLFHSLHLAVLADHLADVDIEVDAVGESIEEYDGNQQAEYGHDDHGSDPGGLLEGCMHG